MLRNKFLSAKISISDLVVVSFSAGEERVSQVRLVVVLSGGGGHASTQTWTAPPSLPPPVYSVNVLFPRQEQQIILNAV